ncbi:unnamed protein product [Discosporangium mesarthrocarpum]
MVSKENRGLGMGGGGGGGGFGFFVGEDLRQGTSGPCTTFGNDRPLSLGPTFVVLLVEVWGFQTAGPRKAKTML